MRTAVAACCLLALGCGGPKITGVRVRVQFPEGEIRQLAFDVHDSRLDGGEGPLFNSASTVLPSHEGAPLTSPQDLVVYFDDIDGLPVTCAAFGLPGGALSDKRLVSLKVHEIVPCELSLGAPDGGNSTGDDAGAPDGGAALVDGSIDAVSMDSGSAALDTTPALDGAEVVEAGSPASDGPALAVDGPVVDAPISADTALAHDTTSLPADMALPVDASLRLDAPPLADAPPAPDAAVVNGCASGARKAFVDARFTSIAGCGAAPVTYAGAVSTAAAVCAPGWHWCRADELRAYKTSAAPAQVPGASCGWLDDTQVTCSGPSHTAYSQASCAGLSLQSSTGGASTNAPCTVDLGCTSPWKFAVELTKWDTTSLSDPQGCLEHVGFECGGTGGSSCWILCCQ